MPPLGSGLPRAQAAAREALACPSHAGGRYSIFEGMSLFSLCSVDRGSGRPDLVEILHEIRVRSKPSLPASAVDRYGDGTFRACLRPSRRRRTEDARAALLSGYGAARNTESGLLRDSTEQMTRSALDDILAKALSAEKRQQLEAEGAALGA